MSHNMYSSIRNDLDAASSMRSTVQRKEAGPHICTFDMPHMGPGYYPMQPAPRSPTCRISQAERFGNLGRAVPETWTNPNISPVMYDYERYRHYQRDQKWLMLERCAYREREAAMKKPCKFPITRAQRVEAEIVAARPDLDSCAFKDKNAWTKGVYVTCSSRFTPREKRPQSASPDQYLRSRSGSPCGMIGVEFQRGKMIPRKEPVRRKDPKDIRTPPSKRPQTSLAVRTQGRSPVAWRSNSPAAVSPPDAKGVTFEATADGAEANIKTASKRDSTPSDGFVIDKTSMAYLLKDLGNTCKSSFRSTVSRSPRTNPIRGQPETQKPDCPIGPGYYEI